MYVCVCVCVCVCVYACMPGSLNQPVYVSLSGSFLASGLVESAGLPIGSLSLSASSVLPLIQPHGFLTSVQ